MPVPSPSATLIAVEDFESYRDTNNPLDDTPVYQAMFDWLEDTYVPGMHRTVDMMGRVPLFQSPIQIKGHECEFLLPVEFEFEFLDVQPYCVTINAQQATFCGALRVVLTAAPQRIEDRMVQDIVHLHRCWRTQFDGFMLAGARRFGIAVASDVEVFPYDAPNNIDCQLGHVTVQMCGTLGTNHAFLGLPRPFAARYDLLNSVVDQVSVLDIDFTDIEDTILPGDLVVVEVEGTRTRHVVMVVNEVAGVVDVYPMIPPSESAAGTAMFIVGGGLSLAGGDTTGIGFQRMSAMHCGTALRLGGLYGGSYDGLTAEGCGCGIQLGARPNEPVISAHFGQVHLEANTIDLIKVTRARCPITINSTVSTTPWEGLEPISLVDGVPIRPGFGTMLGVSTHKYGLLDTNRLQGPRGSYREVLSNGFDEHASNNGTITEVGDIELSLVWDEQANKLWGLDTARVELPLAMDADHLVVRNLSHADGVTIAYQPTELVSIDLPGPCTVLFVFNHETQDWVVRTIPMLSPAVASIVEVH